MTTLLSTSVSFIKTIIIHLWLSISSVKFYEKVFNNYKGYGIKYILTLALFASLICTMLFLFHLDKIRSYLNDDNMSNNVEEIDHVFRQLPPIDYDGLKISINEEVPLFLYDLNSSKVLALDPYNKLMPKEKSKLAIILGSHKIIINIIDSEGELLNNLPIKYTQIFGNDPQILTQEVIKSSFAEIFDNASSVFIYLMFPILALLIFINLLLEKSFLILITYLITRLFTIKTSLQTCIRMVLFASGIFVLLQFVVILTMPALSTVLWGVQTWANMLMILGILKASGRYKLFSRYFKAISYFQQGQNKSEIAKLIKLKDCWKKK